MIASHAGVCRGARFSSIPSLWAPLKTPAWEATKMIDGSEKRNNVSWLLNSRIRVFLKSAVREWVRILFASELAWVAFVHPSYYEDKDRGQTITAKKPD